MDQDGGAGGSDRAREPGEEDVGFTLSNPLASFLSTVRKVLFEPVGFFRRLSGQRAVSWSPVVFALICALISAPLALLVAPYDPLAGNEVGWEEFFANARSSEDAAVELVVMAAIFLIVAPLSLLLGMFLSAAITHILVWIFVRQTNAGFYNTLRVIAYTSATTLLDWIPVVGLLVSLYGLYLTFVGIREMHETTTGRALAVVALPVVLFVVLNILPWLPQEA